jgi:hypothetical protein
MGLVPTRPSRADATHGVDATRPVRPGKPYDRVTCGPARRAGIFFGKREGSDSLCRAAQEERVALQPLALLPISGTFRMP